MTTRIWDLFSLEEYYRCRDEGFIKEQKHSNERLTIVNYTPQAQYANEWNDVTRACRGLIFDDMDIVRARPFPKFFNWDQMGAPKLPVGSVRVAPKMDGSLGILYPTERGFAIATRGSFVSDQAIRGTEIFKELADDAGFQPWPDRTYLFEIIYPENRIVVDYGDRSTLVLLDVIDNATGKSDIAAFDNTLWFDKVAWKMVPEFRHDLIESIPNGDEGLVFYWWGQDVRVKMKAAEYVRLHRIITNTSTKTIWEHLATGRPVTDLLEQVPDEFYTWVQEIVDDLWRQFNDLDVVIGVEFHDITQSITWDSVGGVTRVLTEQMSAADVKREYRKLFAAKASKSEYRDVLFAQLDGKPWRHLVWKRLKPAYSRPFTNQTEDNS